MRRAPIGTTPWSSWALRKASSSSSWPRWAMASSTTASSWRSSTSTTLRSTSLSSCKDVWLGRSRGTHGHGCYKQRKTAQCLCMCYIEDVSRILHVSNRLRASANPPTHQLHQSQPAPLTQAAEPSQSSQMATLSFRRVLSGYTLPKWSY